MNALEAIVKEIDEKAAQLSNYIAAGSAKSYDEYQNLCGQVKGLLHVREYTTSLNQEIEES